MVKGCRLGVSYASSKNAGFTELLILKLSKRDMCRSEILSSFKEMPRYLILEYLRRIIIPRDYYTVSAGKWFINDKGEKDRVYSLVSVDIEKATAPKPIKLSLTICEYKHKYRNEESRCKHKKIAKKRAALIKAGKYNAEAERMLCAMQ